MDFLKNYLARLQQQFNQLSASQKMLTMSLMAIMVMTLLWWGRYAGTAEMEPVLDQDFPPEDIARVTSDLRSRGINYTVTGARVLVPSDRKVEVLGSLIYQDMLPHDSPTPLLDLLNKSSSPFDSSTKTDLIATEGQQQYLAMIIRAFPQVRHAMVVLAAPQHRTFNNPGSATATVYIQSKSGGKPDNRLATAAADVVSGAVSGMSRSSVHVIVDGVARPVAPDGTDQDAGVSSTYLDQVREAEKYYADQIAEHFSYCDGVMVHVNVLPKTESSDSTEKKYDAKGSITKDNESETESQATPGGGRAGGDPGVVPNTGSNLGMSVAEAAGGGGEGSSMKKEHTKSTSYVPETQITKHDPSGSCKVQSASVTFPRSYFVRAYEIETHTDKEPSEALLGPYIRDRLEKFKADIKNCVNLESDNAIALDTYTELQPVETQSPSQMTSGVTMMLGNHVREIALGALAVMSLFMVSMIVRKSGPALMLAGAGVGGGDANLGRMEIPTAGSTVDVLLAKAIGKTGDVTTEVGEGGKTLDGVELDEEAVRSQQVVEQVSTLVKDNPDAAANLIKRWMNRS